MDEEIGATKKIGTWELTNLPPRKKPIGVTCVYKMKPIGVKWVYKMKYKSNGEIDHFKARSEAMGYKSNGEIDQFKARSVAMGCKSNGEIDCFKARSVAMGYKQKQGIDYFEVFAAVSRLDTVHMLISLDAQNNWKLYQMDVKSTFLNGFLEKEIYVDQPAGYVKKGEENNRAYSRRKLYMA